MVRINLKMLHSKMLLQQCMLEKKLHLNMNFKKMLLLNGLHQVIRLRKFQMVKLLLYLVYRAGCAVRAVCTDCGLAWQERDHRHDRSSRYHHSAFGRIRHLGKVLCRLACQGIDASFRICNLFFHDAGCVQHQRSGILRIRYLLLRVHDGTVAGEETLEQLTWR